MPEEEVVHVEEWCPSCGGAMDVTAQEPFTQVRCPACDSLVRVRALFNQFTIQALIGEGGMSRVFSATDNILERTVALKILNRSFSRDSTRAAQFEKEAITTASISHANVIKVFSTGYDQGQFYIAMENMEGGSLEERFRDAGNLEEEEILDIGIDVVQGLKAAHLAGLIHRDIKPGNILFARDGTPKIVDFGLALFHETDVDDSGEIWATPFYVPPEKLAGKADDMRGDIYSLGATLYHALIGEPTHEANTSSIDKLKEIKSKPVRVADANPLISDATCEVLDRMLEVDPKKRQENYTQVLQEIVLARAAFDEVPEGEKDPVKASAGGGAKTPYMLIAAILGVACVGLLALILRGQFSGGSPDAEERRGDSGTSVTTPLIVTPTAVEETGSTISERFLQARDAMLAGEFEEASKGFSRLAREQAVPAQTRGWTLFNGGVAHFLQGEMEDGRDRFKALGRLAKEVDDGSDSGEELADFWSRVAEVGGSPLPPSEAVVADFSRLGYDPLGRLVAGLILWQHGSRDRAVDRLASLSGIQSAKDRLWMSGYAKLAEPYLSDGDLMARLPDLDPMLEGDFLQDAIAQVENGRREIQTPGRAPAATARMLAWFESLAAAQVEMQQQEVMSNIVEVREEELDSFLWILKQVEPHGATFEFTDAADTLREAGFESPEVVAALNDQLYLWDSADACLAQLIEDLMTRGWTGAITRADAPPIVGSVVSADREAVVVKLAFGESRIPITELAEWIVRTAWQYAEGTADSTDHYRRMELLVAFARQVGMKQYADDLSTRLMRENRAFRERWIRVMQSTGDGI